LFLNFHSNPVPPVALLLATALAWLSVPLCSTRAPLIAWAVCRALVAAACTVVGAPLRAFLILDYGIAHACFGFLDPGLNPVALTALLLLDDGRSVGNDGLRSWFHGIGRIGGRFLRRDWLRRAAIGIVEIKVDVAPLDTLLAPEVELIAVGAVHRDTLLLAAGPEMCFDALA